MSRARDNGNNYSGDKPQIIDAKGDLIVGLTDNNAIKVPVGSNNTVLTADSTTTSGVKWAALPASGSMTLISTLTLSSSTSPVSFTSIPGTYKDLLMIFSSVRTSSGSPVGMFFDFNSNTAGNYHYTTIQMGGGAFESRQILSGTSFGGSGTNQTHFVTIGNSGSSFDMQGWMRINDYANTSHAKFAQAVSNAGQGGGAVGTQAHGVWNNTSAVTSIRIYDKSSGNFASGTITLWGVN